MRYEKRSRKPEGFYIVEGSGRSGFGGHGGAHSMRYLEQGRSLTASGVDHEVLGHPQARRHILEKALGQHGRASEICLSSG
jgi:hypothetical protein